MVEALVTYLIVGVAAVWVLWSLLLPARLRRAIRRRLGGRAGMAAGPAAMQGCDVAECTGCGHARRRRPSNRAFLPPAR